MDVHVQGEHDQPYICVDNKIPNLTEEVLRQIEPKEEDEES